MHQIINLNGTSYDYDTFIFRFAFRDWLSLCEDFNLYRADSFWTDSLFVRVIIKKSMLVKTRTLKEGDGITIDPLGVIYRQTDKGLVLEGLDEYSALLPRSGWYVEEYHVAMDVVEIEPWAFSHSQFKKVILPDGLIHILAYAFNDCKSLEEIVLPDTVNFVSPSAFVGCKSLRKIILTDSISFINPYEESPMVDGTPDWFLESSVDSLESIEIPGDKRAMLEEQLPHLKHLFVDK